MMSLLRASAAGPKGGEGGGVPVAGPTAKSMLAGRAEISILVIYRQIQFTMFFYPGILPSVCDQF